MPENRQRTFLAGVALALLLYATAYGSTVFRKVQVFIGEGTPEPAG